MQADTTVIEIGNSAFVLVKEYDIDSNILTPADAFTCTLGGIRKGINAGEEFKLFINSKVEMTGIIDAVSFNYSKTESSTRIEGRDLMGLLVDSSVEPENFKTLKDITVKAMALRLLKNFPLFKEAKIRVGSASPKSPKILKKSKEEEGTTPAVQFVPGTSIFSALSDYAQRQGLIFWMEADGTLVFDTPRFQNSPPEFSFNQTNIKSANLTDSALHRFSKIILKAQLQGKDSLSTGDHDVEVTASDKNFPLYKPLVLQSQTSDKLSAKKQVEWAMAKRAVQSWKLTITVAGHNQEGKNYFANSLCQIKEEPLNLSGLYLILGRTFKKSRSEGTTTKLTIGKVMEGYSVV